MDDYEAYLRKQRRNTYLGLALVTVATASVPLVLWKTRVISEDAAKGIAFVGVFFLVTGIRFAFRLRMNQRYS